jgi:hypothetical protein
MSRYRHWSGDVIGGPSRSNPAYRGKAIALLVRKIGSKAIGIAAAKQRVEIGSEQ